MIPASDEARVRTALGYMDERKVLQWARATICPTITQRDIVRLSRRMVKQPRSIGAGAHSWSGRFEPHSSLVDHGDLASKINAYIAARSKECGVDPSQYRRALGWR